MTSAEPAAGTGPTDRRHDLLERLADIIAEDGIEGVSIRVLASRANVSIGTVQYYFPTKNDLLLSAWAHVRSQASRRFKESGVMEEGPQQQLRRFTELLLAPTSDDRLSRVWLALVARAAHDSQIAQLHRGQWQETESLLAGALRRANPSRAAESEQAAGELLALLDGLSIAVLTEPDRMPPARAAKTTDTWIASWLADSPGRTGRSPGIGDGGLP